MGAISAIALSFWVILVSLTWIAAITASAHLLGVVGIIAVVLVFLDVFWLYGRHYARRGD